MSGLTAASMLGDADEFSSVLDEISPYTGFGPQPPSPQPDQSDQVAKLAAATLYKGPSPAIRTGAGPVYGPRQPMPSPASTGAGPVYGPQQPTPEEMARMPSYPSATSKPSTPTSSAAPAMSAHAQVAAIRAAQAAARKAQRDTGARPMTERQQVQTILAVQGGPTLGTGAKVALAGLGVVALLSLGVLAFK